MSRCMPTCSLCLQERELEGSHVIPRFIGKWIKQTSVTGFLTSAEKPLERLQDLPSLPLLCSECEEKFSGLETYFANTIFHPFVDKGVRTFLYDIRLQAFILSLSWRVLKATYADVVKEVPYHLKLLDSAEADWRNFLLKKDVKAEPYENHLLFMDRKARGKVPDKFEWYAFRTAETTMGGNGDRLFAYTKLPWMFLVTSVYPTHLDGWQGTLVQVNGKISPPQTVEDSWFGTFLETRVDIVSQSISEPSSEKVSERVMKAVRRNPKRFLGSESFKTMTAEKERIRDEERRSGASRDKKKVADD